MVNGGLETILGTCDPDRTLTRAMRHSLMAGGKRLRPVLCLAATEAVGGDPRLGLPFACAVEMVHTYSLIHDDLPAMDNDDLRRGLPTCHKAFSEATAILAGDGLLTHAFLVLARPRSWFEVFPDPGTLLELSAILADAAGIDGMIEGQMMDMLAQGTGQPSPGNDATLGQLLSMHTRKTGRMIMASVDAGAVSGGAGTGIREALAEYSRNIGLAFQVTDDILNVEGDPALLGKAVGSDALNRKMTFPALMGLAASRAYAADLVDRALLALRPLDRTGCDPLKAIARYVLERKR
jgi:geranylgeranyl diphosphate synthase type II